MSCVKQSGENGERPAGSGPVVQRIRRHGAARAACRRRRGTQWPAREGCRGAAAGACTCRTTTCSRRRCARPRTCRCRTPPRSRSHPCLQMHRCGCTRCLNLLLTYPGRLPRQLRILRSRAAPRSRARTTRTATSSGELAGVPMRRWGHRSRATGQRARSTHVHLDDHAPGLGCDTVRRAEGLDGEDRPCRDPVSILSRSTTMPARRTSRASGTSAPTSSRSRLDAANRRNLDARASRAWQSGSAQVAEVLEILLDARRHLGPQKFGAHVHCRHGETEHEGLSLVQQLVDLGRPQPPVQLLPSGGR